MICKDIEIVFDPHSYLPPYGENEIRVSFINGSLTVYIIYDGDDEEQSLEIIFDKVKYYSMKAIPGVSIEEMVYEKNNRLGALVEFRSSGLAKKWKELSGFSYRHFTMYFKSQNRLIEVVCEEVKVP